MASSDWEEEEKTRILFKKTQPFHSFYFVSLRLFSKNRSALHPYFQLHVHVTGKIGLVLNSTWCRNFSFHFIETCR